jgi:sporadic carbohydrate cluster protein (TIGR04323 family)
MTAPAGYRGYIASRPISGNRTAQHVQNLVIRDYAERHGLLYKLSATEYAMPGCYMMLREVMQELPTLEGIIAFSMFMLPPSRPARHELYDAVLGGAKALHFALEAFAVKTPSDIRRVEDIWMIERATRKPVGV